MKINIDNLNNLQLVGVYQIKNLVNNKIYIGSTKQSFRVRLNHHLQALRNNKHKNKHLQRAWNKYGEDNFEFSILTICNKKDTYFYEQQFLDNRNLKMSYNINPNATGPCYEQKSIQKHIISKKRFFKQCIFYYKKYKNKQINLNEIPNKYRATILNYINYIPWNKGKHYDSTDHLKVSHRMTDKLKNKYLIQKEKIRNNNSVVYVYDKNKNFLDCFRSSKDLEELSLTLNFPIESRFNTPRMGKPIKFLQSCNINRSIKTGKSYKGLYFTNQPLHLGIDDKNEPKSVKVCDDNTEVNKEIKESLSPYSIETETNKLE